MSPISIRRANKVRVFLVDGGARLSTRWFGSFFNEPDLAYILRFLCILEIERFSFFDVYLLVG